MNETRILVVDDEEDLCEILKFNLENEGYEVDTANSAEEALKLDICSYQLILLDVMMGEISGFIFGVYDSQDEEASFMGYTDAVAAIRLIKKTIEE